MHFNPTFRRMDQLQQAFVVVFVLILGHSAGRDLRPSDHGLAYQEESFPPTQNGDDDSQKMRSFFGAAATVQLPEAKNIADALRSAGAERGGARDAGGDHVRLGLVVASAVCGLTGVLLLAVSGVAFLIRRGKAEIPPSTSAPATEPVKGSG
ncbi:uncharacterized protein LOC127249560 [Andrographis paniculata]|uniref:uncharacterized protein LOC127249560 n=1 Tax=Andrographis paniculata TaxID=175694 RepID=UPI0021E7C847|nr:uncharacterized protein LOC127249560 [Andrographis paniculata]